MLFVASRAVCGFQFGRSQQHVFGSKRTGNQGVVERRSGHWRGVNIILLSEQVEHPPEELVAVSANVERPVRIRFGVTDTGRDVCGVTLPAV